MLIRNEIKLVKTILQQAIGQDYPEIGGLPDLRLINWDYFRNFIVYHELTPFAYLALKNIDSGVPAGLMELLKHNYYYAVYLSNQLWQEFMRISFAFKDASVTMVPIKGMAFLKTIYKGQPVRPMRDIDFLIEEKNILQAEGILNNLGYKKELYGLKEDYWRNDQYHLAFYKDGNHKSLMLELHWDLDYGRKDYNIMPDVWKNLRTTDVDNVELKILSPEDTLISLALHYRRPGKILPLKYICDIALILKREGNFLDWDYLTEKARDFGLRSALFFMFSQLPLFLNEDFITADFYERLKIRAFKKKLILRFLKKHIYSFHPQSEGKNIFLKTHFLLFDRIRDPIDYIINIPQEQFAKFHGLKAYAKKTTLLYRLRFLVYAFGCLKILFAPLTEIITRTFRSR